MEINTENWFYSLSIIRESTLLKNAYLEATKTAFNYDLIKESFKAGYLKESIINDVDRIGAICYDLNGKLFLHGETKGDFDLVGDNLGNQPLTELFDMTTEMNKGDSYSFYVSTTSYFKIASIEDCVKVNEYLKTLS